jgi:hypothetical protein
VSEVITKDNLCSYFHLWDGKYRRLTRSFESDIPSFASHKEAQAWFEELFGDDFVLADTTMVDGEKLWIYTLIVNRSEWEAGREQLRELGYSSGMGFMMSTHKIEIFDSGNVHIVY